MTRDSYQIYHQLVFSVFQISFLPYKIVAHEEGSENIDEEQNKDDDPTPYLKKGDKKRNTNDSINQGEEQKWYAKTQLRKTTRATFPAK